MVNEKIKTCEEYVLNVLAKTEQDLVVAIDLSKTLKARNEKLSTELDSITTLVKEMAQHLVIKSGEGKYDYLYADDTFIGLVDESEKADTQDKFVVSLIRLAECVGIDLHIPVEREE